MPPIAPSDIAFEGAGAVTQPITYPDLLIRRQQVISGTDEEKVRWIYSLYNKYHDFWRTDRERMIRNMRLFWGADYAQWPQYIVDRLRAEGRQAPTYNIVSDKVESMASMILKNDFDMKFEPMTGEIDSLTLEAQDIMYSDKELMDWDASKVDFLVKGITHVGCERMIVSDRYNPMGNVGYVSEDPFMLLRDPSWKSTDGRDLKSLFKFGYYDPDEIIDHYPNKSEEIKQHQEKILKEGPEFGPQDIYLNPYVDTRWGSKWLVIEWHHIREEERWWEYDLRNGTPFPETDVQGKQRYVEKNGLGDDEITWIKQKLNRYYVTSIIPALGYQFLLEDRLHEIQVDRLPFFFWGITRFNGQYRGLGDLLYDPQININKNEMDMADIRSRAARGSFFIDPEIVDGDPEKMQEIELNWNSAAARIWTEHGKLAEGKKYLLEIPTSHIPSDLVQNTDRMLFMADRLSKVQAAQQGRAESGQESGRLFQSKYEAGIISMGIINKTLMRHENDKAEAYLTQIKSTYAGPERQFARAGGGQPININQRMILETGEVGIRNNISRLPRHKIIITQSPKGIDVRTNKRIVNAELMKQSIDKPLISLVFFGNVYETIEASDDEKEEFKKALELEKSVAALRLANEATVLQVTMVQAQLQYQKMTGQEMDTRLIDSIASGGPKGTGKLSPGDVPPNISGKDELGPGGGRPLSAGNIDQLIGTPQQGKQEIQAIASRAGAVT